MYFLRLTCPTRSLRVSRRCDCAYTGARERTPPRARKAGKERGKRQKKTRQQLTKRLQVPPRKSFE